MPNQTKPARDLNLPQDRYIAALERIKGQVENDGLKLDFEDSTTTGDKYTHASWGLCSGSAAQWPDAQDHLWPDQFKAHGRVAPLYRKERQFCPMDTRPFHTKPPSSMDLFQGCFYTCRLFNPGSRSAGKGKPADQFPRPDRDEAVHLYQITITRAKRT